MLLGGYCQLFPICLQLQLQFVCACTKRWGGSRYWRLIYNFYNKNHSARVRLWLCAFTVEIRYVLPGTFDGEGGRNRHRSREALVPCRTRCLDLRGILLQVSGVPCQTFGHEKIVLFIVSAPDFWLPWSGARLMIRHPDLGLIWWSVTLIWGSFEWCN